MYRFGLPGSANRQLRDDVLQLLWNDAEIRETRRIRGRNVIGLKKINLSNG
jgi:hypothetical protein